MNGYTWNIAGAAAGIALAAGLAGPVCSARADSIYARAAGKARAIVADDTARAVGDSITILIQETSQIVNSIERNMEKQTSRNASMSGTATTGDIFRSWIGKVFTFPTVAVQGQTDNKFDGKSDYDNKRSFTDAITVTVEDVLPNGNLVVSGKRERESEGDKQIIHVSGIVRPSDVTFDNTVLSDKVANFQMIFDLKGTDRQISSPGWFGKILNFLSPT